MNGTCRLLTLMLTALALHGCSDGHKSSSNDERAVSYNNEKPSDKSEQIASVNPEQLMSEAVKVKDCSNLAFLFSGLSTNETDTFGSMMRTTKVGHEAAVMLAMKSGLSRTEAEERLQSVSGYESYLGQPVSGEMAQQLKSKMVTCLSYLGGQSIGAMAYQDALEVVR